MNTVWTSDTWTADRVILPLRQAISAGKLWEKALATAIQGAKDMPYGDLAEMINDLTEMQSVVADLIERAEELAKKGA